MMKQIIFPAALVMGLGLWVGCRAAAADFDFAHGVASGDPLPNRVIIWTRVTTAATGTIDVTWEVARDAEMRDVISGGRTRTGPARDYTVKVDVGGLTPGGTYYYRFAAGQTLSPTGRTKIPAVGRVERLKLGVVSCANYAAGYFNTYRALAARDDIDVVVHLGDYIYEYHQGGYGNHDQRPLQPEHEIISLEDYRRRHALYRTDPDLQALHQAHPMIAVWDDHETANDSWRGGAQNHNNDGADEGPWETRKANGIQAYLEWLPIRETGPGNPARIYRSFSFGDLLRLIMLDTRLVGRDEPLTWRMFETGDEKAPVDLDKFLQAYDEPGRSILGQAQTAWLEGELERSLAGGQVWRLLGQQVIFAPFNMPDFSGIKKFEEFPNLLYVSLKAQESRRQLPYNLDSWSGYPETVDQVMDMARKNGDRLIVLSGDTHMSWANEIIDPMDGGSLGVEFATPGVSSPNLGSYIPDQYQLVEERIVARNPHVKYFNAIGRGFMLLDVTPRRIHAEWYYVEVEEPSDEAICGMAMDVMAEDRGRLLDAACGE